MDQAVIQDALCAVALVTGLVAATKIVMGSLQQRAVARHDRAVAASASRARAVAARATPVEAARAPVRVVPQPRPALQRHVPASRPTVTPVETSGSCPLSGGECGRRAS